MNSTVTLCKFVICWYRCACLTTETCFDGFSWANYWKALYVTLFKKATLPGIVFHVQSFIHIFLLSDRNISKCRNAFKEFLRFFPYIFVSDYCQNLKNLNRRETIAERFIDIWDFDENYCVFGTVHRWGTQYIYAMPGWRITSMI